MDRQELEDLFDEVAEEAGVAVEKVAVTLQSFLQKAAKKLERGARLKVPGVGTFTASKSKPRTGRSAEFRLKLNRGKK